ncbi:MAG TPA: NAD(+) diphosphatase [Hyphomicrobiales bacterium]|nr:NAD(+) diphosphatase [Hyphomicrobiales bacterium]
MTLGPEPFAAIAYGVNGLDRGGDRRNDPAFIAAEEADDSGLTYVMSADRAVLRAGDPPLALFAPAEAALLDPGAARLYLGRPAGGPPHYAAVIAAEAAERLAADPAFTVIDFRTLAAQQLVSDRDLGALGLAKSLASWHARHRFCSNCGTLTEVAGGGWRRQCPSCGTEHFPRVDPVVIMLIADGDRALLGRQPRFAKGSYSCLAGFLEPGETVENAVRREVMEEAGIAVGAVSYVGAQPWPFPSSLMLGCRGEALSREINFDPTELEEARWFDRETLRLMLARQHPDGLMCPPPLAIAHHLIRRFVDEG